jgi:hypothetical protein
LLVVEETPKGGGDRHVPEAGLTYMEQQVSTWMDAMMMLTLLTLICNERNRGEFLGMGHTAPGFI